MIGFGKPAARTSCAAGGSHQKLNSAEGVIAGAFRAAHHHQSTGLAGQPGVELQLPVRGW